MQLEDSNHAITLDGAGIAKGSELLEMDEEWRLAVASGQVALTTVSGTVTLSSRWFRCPESRAERVKAEFLAE